MGITHDAYLFEPNRFVNEALPYVEALEASTEGYALIRTAAIELYDNNAEVRSLAERYGGWDRNAIVTQMPSGHPSAPEDIAFWLVILLYGHCRTKEPCPLGLGSQWSSFDGVLAALGWSDTDRDLLLRGNRFTHLVGKTLNEKTGRPYEAHATAYWDHVDPFSQGGRAGWISFQEAQKLLRRAADDKHRLRGIAHTLEADYEELKKVHRSALEMLTASEQGRCGLCVILSG
jgi:hypothetical protein